MKTILFVFGIVYSFFLVMAPLFAVALPFFLIGKLFKSKTLEEYGFNYAYSLDQTANTLWLGDPDETISSRTGRAIESGKAKRWVYWFAKFVDCLFLMFGDENHVQKSIEQRKFTKELDSWIKD